ncbi:unnamed protein product [Cylicocyclus nassatus]|uniref:Uncharacterized protein n=1 Tax=Cylicocyclus nassatus TaxID=53992 RepID=A0AA36GDQ6_CYLNA|nr:unnamed protein product [Cylicocyclus nassatus]
MFNYLILIAFLVVAGVNSQFFGGGPFGGYRGGFGGFGNRGYGGGYGGQGGYGGGYNRGFGGGFGRGGYITTKSVALPPFARGLVNCHLWRSRTLPCALDITAQTTLVYNMKMYVLFLIAVLATGVNSQLIKTNLGKQYAGQQGGGYSASASSGPPHMNKYLQHGEPGGTHF